MMALNLLLLGWWETLVTVMCVALILRIGMTEKVLLRRLTKHFYTVSPKIGRFPTLIYIGNCVMTFWILKSLYNEHCRPTGWLKKDFFSFVRVSDEHFYAVGAPELTRRSLSTVPLTAAGVGKSVSPGSGADDGGRTGATGLGTDYFIKCPQCQNGYPGFQALKEHVESSHPPPPQVRGGDDGASQPTSPVGSPAPNTPGGGYACPQCNTSFLHKDQLEKHELLHSPNAQVVSKSSSLLLHFGFAMAR